MVSVAGVAGFEPTNDGVRVRCLTAWRHPNVLLTNSILSDLARFSKRFCSLFRNFFALPQTTLNEACPPKAFALPREEPLF